MHQFECSVRSNQFSSIARWLQHFITLMSFLFLSQMAVLNIAMV